MSLFKYFSQDIMKKILFVTAIFFGVISNSNAITRFVKSTATGTATGDSWANASANLQAMINASSSGDMVWVATGSYKPTAYPTGCTNCSSSRSFTFSMKNGVSVLGNFGGTETLITQRNRFINPTVLDGNLGDKNLSSDNAYHVVMAIGLTSGLLDGFYIQSGNADNIGQTNITYNATNYSTNNNYGGGIYNQNSVFTYQKCLIRQNNATVGGGADMFNAGTTEIKSCIFDDNNATSIGGGLNCEGSSLRVDNCVFTNNSASSGGALSHVISSFSYIINCTFYGNAGSTTGGGIHNTLSNPVIENCVIWGNTGGGTQGINNSGGSPAVSNSIVQSGFSGCTNCPNTNGNIDPSFVNSADPNGTDNIWKSSDDGLALSLCSPGIDVGKALGFYGDYDITEQNRNFDVPFRTNLNPASNFDLGAYENQSTSPIKVYVNNLLTTGANNGTSWANAFRNPTTALQDGLNAVSCEGNEIWVAAGTYKPSAYPAGCAGCSSNRDFSFLLVNKVNIYGGFAGIETNINQRGKEHPSIISGDIGTENVETDNVYHTIIANNCTSNTILDGFFITSGGTPDNLPNSELISLTGNEFRREFGGGLILVNSSNSIINCVFSGNSSYTGGGIYISKNNATTQNPVISNCTFSSNFSSSGAGIFSSGANTTISKCNFSNNNSSFYGGGITIASGIVQIEKSIFQYNYADNSGGAIFSFANNITKNCLFILNQAQFGAAIANNTVNMPSTLNCTFTGNTSPNDIAIYNYDSNPIIKNSIFWNTTPSALPAILNTGTSASTVSNSIVQGGFVGCTDCPNTNGNVNPLFTNLADLNGLDNILSSFDDGLTLQHTSPAINTGTNTGSSSDDIIGNIRIGNTDIGAYEFMPKNNCVSYKLVSDVPIEPGEHIAAVKIISIGTVGTATNVILSAGSNITLLPGFNTQNGAVFTTKIEGCEDIH